MEKDITTQMKRLNSQVGQTAIDTDMNGNKRFIIAAVCICIAAVLYGIFHTSIPNWVVWENKEIYDSSNTYEIRLSHKKVQVFSNINVSGQQMIWSSDEAIKVQNVLSCDIDGDHEDELLLLCWKKGRYGKSRPFWVKSDEKNWSQHIFVYEFPRHSTTEEETLQITPKWMSSYIGQDVVTISFHTLNHANPAKARLLLTDPDGIVSCWVWESWGFTKEDCDVSFTIFGDNLIHEPIYRYGLQHEESFDFLFAHVKEEIANSDVSVINQETPLVNIPSRYHDYPRFGTPLAVGKAIAQAGFDIVTCATNHALDQGSYGINTTKDYFQQQDILCLGIQSQAESTYQPYEILEKKGIRFALLNYTYGTNGIPISADYPHMVHLLSDEQQIKTDLSLARKDADFIIVFVHWGTEDMTEPDDFQKKWTQIFLDNKVDVVIGTHPHVLQPYEMITSEDGHQMLVYYSLGNFISAQPQKECIKGGMATFTVGLTTDGYRVLRYDLQPLTITWEEDGCYSVYPATTP